MYNRLHDRLASFIRLWFEVYEVQCSACNELTVSFKRL